MTPVYKWLIVMGMLLTPKDTPTTTRNDTVTVERLKDEVKDLKSLKKEVKELNRIVDSTQKAKK